MLDSRSKKLVSLLFAVVILLSCVVVYQFVEPQEVKGEEHQTLGLSVSPFGSTFKLGVNQSKTFTAQALNGSAPFCFSWKIVPSAPLTLQVNGETLQLTEKIVVDDGSLTVCFPEASEDFVTVTLSGIDVNGLVGEADAFIVADPYTSSGYYFDGSQAVYTYKLTSDGLGWYRVYGSNGAALTAYDGTNSTLVTDALLGDMTSGALFLDEVAFDLDLLSSIPEGVRVICSYNAEYWEYINSADSSGSPYTVSVGSGVNTGYYLAQDSQKRVCFASTNAAATIQNAYDTANGGKVFCKLGTYPLGTTTINLDNQYSDVEFEQGSTVTYGGTGYAFNISKTFVKLYIFLIQLTTADSNAVYMTAASNSEVDVQFIDGFNGTAEIGVKMEATDAASHIYSAKVTVREARQLQDVVRVETTAGATPYTNLNYVEIWELGGTINRCIYINALSRQNRLEIHSENGQAEIVGAFNEGYMYLAKSTTGLVVSGSYNHFIIDYEGAGTAVNNTGSYNNIYNQRLGYRGTNSSWNNFAELQLLINPAGVVKSDPGTNYALIQDLYYGAIFAGDAYKPSRCRVAVIATSDEAAVGTGIAVYDRTGNTLICEYTWSGGLTAGSGAWVEFPNFTNDRVFQIKVKGSSATEDVTLYYVGFQFQ